jgi:hypothetical protein
MLKSPNQGNQQLQIPSTNTSICWNKISHRAGTAPPIDAAIHLRDLLGLLDRDAIEVSRTLGALRFIIREHCRHFFENWRDVLGQL